MATLRQNQLKQLNALDRAITNIRKALQIGEKQEQLGLNNGSLGIKAIELIEIYQEQFDVDGCGDLDEKWEGV
jgi:hypothetical protein